MRRRDFIWSAVLKIATRSGWTQQLQKSTGSPLPIAITPTSAMTATGKPRFGFQGQEAPIVICSITNSSHADTPRGIGIPVQFEPVQRGDIACQVPVRCRWVTFGI
jgi:hypothetical protein